MGTKTMSLGTCLLALLAITWTAALAEGKLDNDESIMQHVLILT